MSKTTIFLFIVLFIVAGFLLYIMYGKTQNPVSTSLAKPLPSHAIPINTTLSFSANKSLKPGQTTTVNVIIHNTADHPDLAQLEIGYDPAVVTIDSITPGTFFIKPSVDLEDIDPVAGRISFALRCANDQTSNNRTNCINPNSNIAATIMLSINTYTLQNTTALSFQPKTVVRTFSGKDLLKKTTDLQLPITRFLYPLSSSSGFLKSVINQSVPTTSTLK